MRKRKLTWRLILSSSLFSALTSASAASKASHKLKGNTPDKFVSSSPLSVAAVCSDGIALLAIHTAVSQEPLLVDDDDDTLPPGHPPRNETHPTPTNATTTTRNATNSSNDTTTTTITLRDLPKSHRGPTRIELIDGGGTSLLTAGWAADGATLLRQCRSIAAARAARYGEEATWEGDYGRVVAGEAASWMALRDFSENVRTLSCVGLLASCCAPSKSFLWFLDATGVYRARALAIGNGADVVNKKLVAIDFSKLSKEHGARLLVDIVNEEGLGGRHRHWNLDPKSLVEIGIIDAVGRSMRRVRQPFLP